MWRSPARKFGSASQQYAFQFKILLSNRTQIQILQPKKAGLNRIQNVASLGISEVKKSNIQVQNTSF